MLLRAALAPAARAIVPWRGAARPALVAGFSVVTTVTRRKPPRSPEFAEVTDADVAALESMVGRAGLITDPDELKVLNTDWLGQYTGASRVAVRPASTDEVSRVLQHCHERRIAVTPQGGNTGLVGGSVPVHDELILSLARMNRVTSFDPVSGILVCEAGCILENLEKYANEQGHTMPIDLGAKGSCFIGGNVATNAGGMRLIRYGSLHGSVLGVEAVLADGTVVDTIKTLRKDNTGYDVKQLFIGSEGTLGVVTKVALQLPPKPKSVQVAVIGIADFASVLQVFRLARASLSDILSAFEFFDSASLDLVLQHLSTFGARDPLPSQRFPFYVVVETSGSVEQHDQEKLERFFESGMESGVVADAALAQDTTQARAFWRLREGITEACSREGFVYKYDISLPVAHIYDIVPVMRERLARFPQVKVVGFGHMGDGNLHLNIMSPKFDQTVLDAIEPFVYEWVAGHKGSISAEHGLGVMKASHIGYSQSPAALALMRSLKTALDPRGILNPYKVLPSKEIPVQH